MRAEEQRQTVITIVFYAAMGGLIYFTLHYLVSWLLPLLLGVAIAALMRPATLSFAKKTHVSEKIAAGVTLLFFYLMATGVIVLFLTIILAQVYELLLQLPALYGDSIAPLLDRMADWFYSLAERFNPQAGEGFERFTTAVSDAVQKAAVDGSAHLVGWAAGLAARLPMLLLTAIFTIVISILASVSYREVGLFLKNLVPKKFLPRLSGLQRFMRDTIWQYVRAYTIIMAITFSEVVLGLWMLGFDYVLPVSAAITLVDLLPLIGSGSVLVPWGIVLLAGGDTAGGVGLLMLFGIITVVRNIVEPRVVGKQLGLHPIVTITAMYAGLKIAGFAGMVAAPVSVLLVRHLKNENQS